MTAYPDGFTSRDYEIAQAAAGRFPRLLGELASDVRERRLARIVAGGTGLVGVAALVVTRFAFWDEGEQLTPLVLGLVALAAPLAYLGVRLLLRAARRGAPARATTSFALGRLEASSFGLPLAALALLLPLVIHGAAWVLFQPHEPSLMAWSSLATFGWWVDASAIIVGHAHLVLALLAIRFVVALRRMPTAALAAYPAAKRGWIHLAWTVLVAAVPGIALIGIPPALVAATGALFVPLAYHVVRSSLLAERTILETRDHALVAPIGIEALEAARAS